MQQRFLLQILLLAQHVSGTTMPIIRSSRDLYNSCCLCCLVLWFSSCWFGVELRVMCTVCRMPRYTVEGVWSPETVRIFRRRQNFMLLSESNPGNFIPYFAIPIRLSELLIYLYYIQQNMYRFSIRLY